MEGFHRVILVTRLQLCDTQQQVRFGLALHAALGQTLRQQVAGLVVLLVTQVRKSDANIFITGRRGIGILLDLRERRLVGSGSLLRLVQQTLVLILRTLVGENALLEALFQDVLSFAR